MIKRAMDIVLALGGLLVLAPLLVFLALIIKISDFGPVFFIQQRVGRGGRTFRILKFRTMTAAGGGPAITVSGDKRITPIGVFLRKFKFDELPQLWNVLVGEMSFVGPRPEVPRYVALYTAEQGQVLDLRPGITDLASLAYYNESDILAQSPEPERVYCEQLVPDKIRINLSYAAKANVIWDLLLIITTVTRPLGISCDLFSWLKIDPPKGVSPASTRSP